ncbi:DUF4465 domain-containing protein [Tundrisphaera sp. TA3]|uniref:DUF4465 domain-containing protein n=1 Tax=Tundrisphaera sp. TA3 TaxID=3435775 RepID=UPI003EBC234A
MAAKPLHALRLASLSLALCLAGGRTGLADYTVNFDDLPLAPNSFYNGGTSNGPIIPGPYGPVRDGSFQSGGATFGNRYDLTYGSWGGFAVSNTSDTTTPGLRNQYSAITGTGRGPGADNYGVASGYADTTPTTFDPTPFDPTDPAELMALPTMNLPAGAAILGMYVTNTTYAALSMLQGDGFAKKFGGDTGNDPDFFKLTAYGTDAAGRALANSVDFFLADFRFADNAQDYVVTDWRYMDLSSLAGASRVHFNISTSDVGPYGLNSPAYFAVDDIVLAPGPQAVPEPSSLALVLAGAGTATFALRRGRRTR